MKGTKLKTLRKEENRSAWEKHQFKMEPVMLSTPPKNPWQYYGYEKQVVPGMPNVYGKLTKRERNGYLFEQKINQANNYFNGSY